MKQIWWEKTVEYAFVLHCSASAIASYLPLDGHHESVGDLIYQSDSTFLLIEFKRSRCDINSEIKKYPTGNYEKAKEALSKDGQHHLIMYGKHEDGIFDVIATEYFTCNKKYSLDESLRNGIDKERFDEYIKKLLSFKHPKDPSGPGLFFGLVAAVSINNCKIELMSLMDYLESGGGSTKKMSRRFNEISA